ncbi:10121_t:CDS:2 [Rhizophagus irregularis]|nr:10121_t:CDS:2 [Rhizophagus irregularis]
MNAEFYVEIHRRHAPEMSQMLGDRWRTGQRSQALIQSGHPIADLSPIEKLWSIIKNKVEKRMPRNLDDLEKFMAEE